MMALHIPEEDRSLDIMELTEKAELCEYVTVTGPKKMKWLLYTVYVIQINSGYTNWLDTKNKCFGSSKKSIEFRKLAFTVVIRVNTLVRG